MIAQDQTDDIIMTYHQHDEEQYYNYDDAEETIFQAQVVSDDDSSSHTKVPQVEATLVEPLLSRNKKQTTTTPSRTTTTAPLTVQAIPIGVRPEFCYAQAWLSNKSSSSSSRSNNDAGILFRARSTFGVAVAGLTACSPFRYSNILPDDHIIAVNGLSCADADVARVEKLIAASKDSISIVVHNKEGIPTLVSSSVQKPKQSAKVGITLKNRQGVVRFIKVSKDGLFGQGLLMPQHRCRMINGMPCDAMNARMVGDVIASAADRVTIVSQPPQMSLATSNNNMECYAVTIALYEHRKWWKKIAVGAGVAAAAVMVRSIS